MTSSVSLPCRASTLSDNICVSVDVLVLTAENISLAESRKVPQCAPALLLRRLRYSKKKNQRKGGWDPSDYFHDLGGERADQFWAQRSTHATLQRSRRNLIIDGRNAIRKHNSKKQVLKRAKVQILPKQNSQKKKVRIAFLT